MNLAMRFQMVFGERAIAVRRSYNRLEDCSRRRGQHKSRANRGGADEHAEQHRLGSFPPTTSRDWTVGRRNRPSPLRRSRSPLARPLAFSQRLLDLSHGELVLAVEALGVHSQ